MDFQVITIKTINCWSFCHYLLFKLLTNKKPYFSQLLVVAYNVKKKVSVAGSCRQRESSIKTLRSLHSLTPTNIRDIAC